MHLGTVCPLLYKQLQQANVTDFINFNLEFRNMHLGNFGTDSILCSVVKDDVEH